MDVEFWSAITRPVCTVLLVGTVCYLAIMEKLDSKDFLQLAMVVIMFWFGERQAQKAREEAIREVAKESIK